MCNAIKRVCGYTKYMLQYTEITEIDDNGDNYVRIMLQATVRWRRIGKIQQKIGDNYLRNEIQVPGTER